MISKFSFTVTVVLLLALAAPALAVQPTAFLTKMLPMICMAQEQFGATVRKKEKLFLIGVMPALQSHILEIWKAPKTNGWTITIRSGAEKEICILAAGSQLLPSDYFAESGLPR